MMAYKIILFVLALNLAATILNNYSPLGYSMVSDVPENKFNPNQYDIGSESVLYKLPVVGDIVKGFYWFKNMIGWVFDGFPQLLSNIGIPTEIVNSIRVLIGAVFVVAFIQIITGRQVE